MNRRFQRAFTAIELIVVVVVLVILVCVVLPYLAKAKQTTKRDSCISNLKQIGVGFRLFAGDNDNKYPHFTTKSGNGYVWSNFEAAGPEITSPRVLVCPQDSARMKNAPKTIPSDFSARVYGFANLANQENCLSYFYGLSAGGTTNTTDATQPNSILVGDRNLTANQASAPNGPNVSPKWSYAGLGPTGINLGIPLGGGVNGSKPPNCGWNSALHHFRGDIVLGDGSAREVTTHQLIDQLNRSEDTNNFCLFPIKSPGEN